MNSYMLPDIARQSDWSDEQLDHERQRRFHVICRAWYTEKAGNSAQLPRKPARSMMDIGRIDFGMTFEDAFRLSHASGRSRYYSTSICKGRARDKRVSSDVKVQAVKDRNESHAKFSVVAVPVFRYMDDMTREEILEFLEAA
jgi:hypothetical protein